MFYEIYFFNVFFKVGHKGRIKRKWCGVHLGGHVIVKHRSSALCQCHSQRKNYSCCHINTRLTTVELWHGGLWACTRALSGVGDTALAVQHLWPTRSEQVWEGGVSQREEERRGEVIWLKLFVFGPALLSHIPICVSWDSYNSIESLFFYWWDMYTGLRSTGKPQDLYSAVATME